MDQMATICRSNYIHCCASLQASTLTPHIQQGDILISINGTSLITTNGNVHQCAKPEDITRIIKQAKSPKKVRFLRLIRSAGDLLSKGTANPYDFLLDSHETSLLIENAVKSRIPKFVVSKLPTAGKTFDPVSSSLFDVVFSYQQSLGIRIKPYKLKCWRESKQEREKEKEVGKEVEKVPLSVQIEPEVISDESTSHSSGTPSPFSSSSLWKLFECEEELYQSHCYFTGELLKDEVTDSNGVVIGGGGGTADSSPVSGEMRYASFEPVTRPRPPQCVSPPQDPFILTYLDTYDKNIVPEDSPSLALTEEDDIPPPPKLVEEPFFTNPMPAAASKMVKLNLRRSSDSGTSCESSPQIAALGTVIAAKIGKSLNSSFGSPTSALSLSPVSSLGKSVTSEGFTPQFSPLSTMPVSPRECPDPVILSPTPVYPVIISNTPVDPGKLFLTPVDPAILSPTQAVTPQQVKHYHKRNSEILKENKCETPITKNEKIENVNDGLITTPLSHSPILVRAEIMSPTLSNLSEVKMLPESGRIEITRDTVRQDTESVKVKPASTVSSATKEKQNLHADLENVKLRLHFTEVELEETKTLLANKCTTAPPRQMRNNNENNDRNDSGDDGSLELQNVKDELLLLQINFKEQMILNQIEREDMISDLLRARELAKLLTEDLMNIKAERDKINEGTKLIAQRRKSSILSDVERLEEVDFKILTQVLPRMSDLDDALSLSSTAVTVDCTVEGRNAARATWKREHIDEIARNEEMVKQTEQLSVVKQMVAMKEKAAADNAEVTQRNLDYQAAKNRLGLGSLGANRTPSAVVTNTNNNCAGESTGNSTGVSNSTGTGATPWNGSPKSVESPTESVRRMSRPGGKIRTSLPPGGIQTHTTERPPWWRVR